MLRRGGVIPSLSIGLLVLVAILGAVDFRGGTALADSPPTATPLPSWHLTFQIAVDRSNAKIGDTLNYTVTLTAGAPQNNVGIESFFLNGLLYVSGSSRLNGSPIGDPPLVTSIPTRDVYRYSVGNIPIGTTTLTFQGRVGPDAQPYGNKVSSSVHLYFDGTARAVSTVNTNISGYASPTPTATATPTSTSSPTPPATNTPTATSTSEPTATSTPTSTTSIPSTSTATPTPTSTTTVPTATPTTTSTPNPAASPTSTPTPTSTLAAIPTATATSIGIAVATDTPTPTATPTPTSTSVPGATATTPPSPTATTNPGPPTATTTPTPTSTPLPTATPTPSSTPLPTSTPTPTTGPAVLGAAPPPIPTPYLAWPIPDDQCYFAETGFGVSRSSFCDYFQRRGGLSTFGYPISRDFTMLGFVVQFFQRSVFQQMPDGVALMNLLDDGPMPYTQVNFSTFPAPDPELIEGAPSALDPDYAERSIAFVRENVPDEWNGLPVHFQQSFMSTVRYEDAFPDGDGEPALIPLFNLEIWGLPTSRPAFDPNNHNFVFQRFQRGIMHYDASTGMTQGLLIADNLKSIMTGWNLYPDLDLQANGSIYYRQYDPSMPGYLARPDELPGTNLEDAFEPYLPNGTD